jgi:hypothetical protein
VFAYNRVQERSARGEAERAFGSRHADVLLSDPDPATDPDPDGRSEPTFAGVSISRPEIPTRQEIPTQPDAMPDRRVDYIVELAAERTAPASGVLELWAPIERRFSKRVLLAASAGGSWRRLRAGDAGVCDALRAGLQLVTRSGVTGDAEVLEFRSEVESLAAKIGATISAPEMREALDAARELDAVCVEADIQVAIHVVGANVEDAQLAELADRPFQVVRRGDDVTFMLDVPRVPDLPRTYQAMVRAARHLTSSGGRLVDDHGRTLDDQALAAIATQLEPTRRLLAERGIEPGSLLALRLFS